MEAASSSSLQPVLPQTPNLLGQLRQPPTPAPKSLEAVRILLHAGAAKVTVSAVRCENLSAPGGNCAGNQACEGGTKSATEYPSPKVASTWASRECSRWPGRDEGLDLLDCCSLPPRAQAPRALAGPRAQVPDFLLATQLQWPQTQAVLLHKGEFQLQVSPAPMPMAIPMAAGLGEEAPTVDFSGCFHWAASLGLPGGRSASLHMNLPHPFISGREDVPHSQTIHDAG